MHDQIRSAHRLGQSLPIKQVRLMKCELGMKLGALQKTSLAGGHIVEANHAVTRGKQAIYHVAANKPGRARNKNPQSNLPLSDLRNQEKKPAANLNQVR
jgi:hypothetical protein